MNVSEINEVPRMTTRQVILHPAEEGGYWVDVPSLPGCFSQGETKEEALANIREAIALHLEDLAARGEEIPGDPAVNL
jgi:predicted RNase H-like HicB family nuclease